MQTLSFFPRSRPAVLLLLPLAVSLSGFRPAAAQGVEESVRELTELVRAGDFDAALARATSLVVSNPESFDAHLASFRVHFQAFQQHPDGPDGARNLEQALRRLLFARHLDPLNMEAWELSLSFWNPSLLDQGPESPRGRELLREAETLFGEGRRGEASGALTRLVEAEPGYSPALLRLGELHLAGGAHEEALRLARIASQQGPADPAGYLLQARTLALMREAQRAVAQLVHSLRVDPGYPPAWMLLGQLELDGTTIQHMGTYFPKPVWWIIDREIEEPGPEDLSPLPEETRPAWKAYITSKVRWRKFIFRRRNPQFKVYRYTFREELTAVTDMLVIWQEVRASSPDATDVLLDHWLDASQAGALEAALFLDLFVEQFRRDFVLWKRENPEKFDDYFYRFVLPRVTARGVERPTPDSR